MDLTTHQKLYIGNLPKRCSMKKLKAFLKPALKECKASIQMAVDKSGHSLGYALVTVPIRCVDRVLDLDGSHLDNCKVKVKTDAKLRPHSTWESEQNGVFFSKPHHGSTGERIPFGYSIIDCGIKLKRRNKDFHSIMTAASRCGVNQLIIIGTDVGTSRKALEITRLYPDILFCTAGFDPSCARLWTPEEGTLLRDVASDPKCVAVGPCGFDMSSETGILTVEEQLLAFQEQIYCAIELKKPLIVSELSAHTETLGQITTHRASLGPVAIKCDSLSIVENLNDYIATDCHILLYGFPLPVVMQEWLKQAGMDSEKKSTILPLLLLTSNVQKGTTPERTHQYKGFLTENAKILLKSCSQVTNQPTSLPAVVENAAYYLKMEPVDLAAQLKLNAERFFHLGPAEPSEVVTEGPGSGKDSAGLESSYTTFWLVLAAAVILILVHVCIFIVSEYSWS